MANYYLEKVFFIIEQNSNHFISVTNETKLVIHAIDKQKTDHVIACYIVISSVENTLKKLYIQYNLHTVYRKNFYHDKQDKSNELFDKYYLPLLKYIYHHQLIQEWKQNLDAAAYEMFLNKEIKQPQKKRD